MDVLHAGVALCAKVKKKKKEILRTRSPRDHDASCLPIARATSKLEFSGTMRGKICDPR